MKKILLIIVLVSATVTISCAQNAKKGNRAFAAKDYSAALGYFQKAISKGESLDNQTKLNIGSCHYHRKNYRGALEFFNNIPEAEMQPEHFAFYAHCLQATEEYDKAKIYYTKALAAAYPDPALDNYIKACQWAMDNTEPSGVGIDQLQTPYTDPVFDSDSKYEDLINASALSSYPTAVKKGNPYLDYLYSYFNDSNIPEGAPGVLASSVLYPYHNGSITFTENGKTVYFTWGEKDKKTKKTIFKILQAFYEGNAWTKITPLPINGADFSCAHPAISPSGETLFFASNRPDGFGGYDLYVIQKDADGEWSEPQNLGAEINTPGDELFPYLYISGELIFSSDGLPGYGGLDIFVATSKQSDWSNPINVLQPVNSAKDDFGYVINPRNPTKVLFSSNRNGGTRYDYTFGVAPNKPLAGKQPDPVPVVVEPTIQTKPAKDTIKPAVVNTLPTKTTKKVSYRVQVMATRNQLDAKSPVFKGLPIDVYKMNSLYKYTTGLYTDSAEAAKQKDKVTKMGFRDAFVVSYEDTQKNNTGVGSTQGAVQTLSSGSNDVVFQETGVVYRVQIKSSVEPLSNLNMVRGWFAIRYKYMGMYRYTLGEFRDKEDAIDLLNEVVKMGYTDAFVAAFNDGKRDLSIKIYDDKK